jgi:hypothetical protein
MQQHAGGMVTDQWGTANAGTGPGPAPDLGLIPLTIPELLRLLSGTVIPQPRRDPAHRHRWSAWRRHHQYLARRAHQRWNAYADATP